MDTPTAYRSLEKEDRPEIQQVNDQTPSPYNSPPQRLRDDGYDATKRLYTLDKSLKSYITILSIYLAAAIFSVAWSYTGALLDDDASKRRVFRTSDNIPVDQLYSGVALSAFLAPAGVLVQWVVHEFRRLHLFALATQRPIRVRDLDEISDNFSIWTLKTVARYSWWYGLMHTVLILTRTLLVPVGTLILTVGPYTYLKTGHGVVGLPISRADAATRNITALSTSMGGAEGDGFRPSLGRNDTFLSQAVYTFVGNLVSQSALVNVNSGTLGPVPTHNLTFEHNTTYDGLVFFRWDAHCEAATEVSYTSHQQGANTTYNFTLPGGHVESIELMSQRSQSQRIRLWNNATDRTEGKMPTGGTTFFLSATRSISTINETALLDRGADKSLIQTDEGNWISRTKCTPSFEWIIGSCSFNGTTMTSCQPSPGSNTSALDTGALDALGVYMTAIPWYIFENQIGIVDDTLDTLYSIPTSEDLGHFFGNMAHAIVSISTAGYFGMSEVPTLSLVTEQVYIVRTSVLITVMLMLALAVAVSILDIVRNRTRGLPYLPAGFLAIAQAVRGPWWERELEGYLAWDSTKSRKSHSSTVMFGVDDSDPRYIRLAPSVMPIHQ
ncbi:Fc.00g105970.m01.CDS01 [Cosmosporella sp. VM-42]